MFTIYCIVTLYLLDAEAVKKNYIRLYATLGHPFYDHAYSGCIIINNYMNS